MVVLGKIIVSTCISYCQNGGVMLLMNTYTAGVTPGCPKLRNQKSRVKHQIFPEIFIIE